MADLSKGIPLRGVIEGFYGTPWSMPARTGYAAWLAALRCNAYLYAPKADSFLRRAWHQEWPQDDWTSLQRLSAVFREAGVGFGVGLSPFTLYVDYCRPQRRKLEQKIRRLNELDAPLLALLFDDMPGDQPDLAARQAEIVSDCLRWTNAERLLVCPTYYSTDPVLERVFGARPPGYWEQLGAALPDAVDVLWTGDRVCAERLTPGDLEGINRRLNRPVTLWDNYPVNDGAVRSSHLYLDPPPQRAGAALSPVTRGHLCNGMNQAWLTLPALAGLIHQYDPAFDADAWLGDTLGVDTWRRLRADAILFRDQTREDILARNGDWIVQRYAGLDSPAAREVVAWLRGDYVFDPACLTD